MLRCTGGVKNIFAGCDEGCWVTGLLESPGGIFLAAELEVAWRCGVEYLGAVLRARTLRWLGHVERKDMSEILGKSQLREVMSCRPPRRLKKILTKNMPG